MRKGRGGSAAGEKLVRQKWPALLSHVLWSALEMKSDALQA
jgi:hypothetical protein